MAQPPVNIREKCLLLLAQPADLVILDLHLVFETAKLLAYCVQRLKEAQEPRSRRRTRPICGNGDNRGLAVISDGGDRHDPRQRQRCPAKNPGPLAHKPYLLAKYL